MMYNASVCYIGQRFEVWNEKYQKVGSLRPSSQKIIIVTSYNYWCGERHLHFISKCHFIDLKLTVVLQKIYSFEKASAIIKEWNRLLTVETGKHHNLSSAVVFSINNNPASVRRPDHHHLLSLHPNYRFSSPRVFNSPWRWAMRGETRRMSTLMSRLLNARWVGCDAPPNRSEMLERPSRR